MGYVLSPKRTEIVFLKFDKKTNSDSITILHSVNYINL